MKKIIFCLLLAFIITNCDNKEEDLQKNETINSKQLYIINGSIEYISDITDNTKSTKPKFVYQIPEITNEKNEKIYSKNSDEQVIINFAYGIAESTKSGCTRDIYTHSTGQFYTTDNGVYGPNPAPQVNGYLIRGYGQPHQNQYYGSLVLFAKNEIYKTISRGQIWHNNKRGGSAISIEYPFKANVTYEIHIKTFFHDNRKLVDDKYSEGYPTLYAQLTDDAIIRGYINRRTETTDPCDKEGINALSDSNPNYTRSYTLNDQALTMKNIIFLFSPTEEKKAILISLHPAIGTAGVGTHIPTNNYTMRLPSITINEKTFDPSLNVETPNVRFYQEDGRR